MVRACGDSALLLLPSLVYRGKPGPAEPSRASQEAYTAPSDTSHGSTLHMPSSSRRTRPFIPSTLPNQGRAVPNPQTHCALTELICLFARSIIRGPLSLSERSQWLRVPQRSPTTLRGRSPHLRAPVFGTARAVNDDGTAPFQNADRPAIAKLRNASKVLSGSAEPPCSFSAPVVSPRMKPAKRANKVLRA